MVDLVNRLLNAQDHAAAENARLITETTKASRLLASKRQQSNSRTPRLLVLLLTKAPAGADAMPYR